MAKAGNPWDCSDKRYPHILVVELGSGSGQGPLGAEFWDCEDMRVGVTTAPGVSMTHGLGSMHDAWKSALCRGALYNQWEWGCWSGPGVAFLSLGSRSLKCGQGKLSTEPPQKYSCVRGVLSSPQRTQITVLSIRCRYQ